MGKRKEVPHMPGLRKGQDGPTGVDFIALALKVTAFGLHTALP